MTVRKNKIAKWQKQSPEDQLEMIDLYLKDFADRKLHNIYHDIPNLGIGRTMVLKLREYGFFTEETINQHYDTDNQMLAVLFFVDSINPEMKMYLRLKWWQVINHVHE